MYSALACICEARSAIDMLKMTPNTPAQLEFVRKAADHCAERFILDNGLLDEHEVRIAKHNAYIVEKKDSESPACIYHMRYPDDKLYFG